MKVQIQGILAGAAVALFAASPALGATAEEIIAKEKCNKCHTATTTKKGPSWADVAAKYKGQPDAVPKLVEMLKTGGPDDHNKVVASDADLRAVVNVVLASK